MLEKSKRKGRKIPSFANSMGQSCWQCRHALLGESPALPTAWAKAVGKAAVPFANRTLPTAVASLLAKVTTSELTASPFANGTHGCWRSFPNRARVSVGEELFPIT
jgi:hypothetical protein